MSDLNWDQLIEEIGPRLYRYFQYKGAADEASDLTQETLIRWVAIRDRFQPDQGSLMSFVLGIAQNIWRESLRKRRPMESWDETQNFAADFDLFSEVAKADQSEKLRLIVRRLPQVQQDVLYFYFDEEITTREIAEALKMPEGTIKSHLHRAKETIRLILEKELQ